MARIYLAGPMAGRRNMNADAFNRAAFLAHIDGHEVFNPCDLPFGEEDRREAVAVDNDRIESWADEMWMLPGWRTSKGARAEYALAVSLGLPIRYVGYWRELAYELATGFVGIGVLWFLSCLFVLQNNRPAALTVLVGWVVFAITTRKDVP